MTEEAKPTEKVEKQEVEKPEQTETEKVEVTKVELEKMQAALKEANKEAASRRKRLDELEAQETARKEAAMTEAEKATKRIQELEASLKSREIADLKRSIADKVGLPKELALRLVGEKEEDIEADAKALLETLPKQTKPSPGIVTNPGSQGSNKETHEQMKARLHIVANPFDKESIEKRGGGLFNNLEK